MTWPLVDAMRHAERLAVERRGGVLAFENGEARYVVVRSALAPPVSFYWVFDRLSWVVDCRRGADPSVARFVWQVDGRQEAAKIAADWSRDHRQAVRRALRLARGLRPRDQRRPHYRPDPLEAAPW